MPTYTIKDNVSGRTLKVSGDSPPTEQEAAELFGSASQEIVAGTPQEMAQQRARNMQRELGLSDPVAPRGGVSGMMRMKAGFAPTKEEQQAAYEMEYGKGSFLPVSSKRALVRVPDGKGGHQWKVDNPVGFDFGDLAEMTSMGPEIITGGVAAVSAYPGPQGTFAKVAAASGASALAANTMGAIQDAGYRLATGTPVQGSEIAKRRGLGAAIEFVSGLAVPYVGEKVASFVGKSGAARRAINAFLKEGEEAKKALQKTGVGANTTSELGDAVRMLNPSNMTASEAGEKIANVLTEYDQIIQKSSEKLAGRAAGSMEQRALSEIGNATAAPITAPQAGLAAIGAAKKTIQDAQARVDSLYSEAYKKIGEDVAAGGSDKYFIKLNETDKVLKSQRANMLRKDTGEPSDFYTPLLNQIKQIEEAVGVEQKLEAVRNVRSMLGERIKGKGGVFSDMSEGVAKQLYSAVSKDIDDSVAQFSGAGGNLLKAANEEYRRLIQPVEASRFLDNLVNNGFQNPEEVVAQLARGGSADWLAAKSVLPPNTYSAVRRAVVDELMGSSKVAVAGREVADIGKLNRSISSLPPEVKNEIFGGSKPWQALESIGREFDFLQSQKGLFTTQAMPSMNELREAEAIARNQGIDTANAFIRRALNAANQRRSNLAASLVSQTRNGNWKHVAENPEAFFDGFVASGKYGPDYIRGVMRKLPEPVREQVSRAGFQQLFERTRDLTQGTVSKSKGRYDLNVMLRQTLGSKRQQDAVEAVIGPERMETIKNWMKVEMATQIKNANSMRGGRSLAGLIAVAPYGNLFAARATSMALERAAGRSFVAQAGPDIIEMFADARLASRFPTQSAGALQLIQQASSHPLYGTYQEMLRDFTPEQQDAIDAYLKGNPGTGTGDIMKAISKTAPRLKP